MAETVEEFLKRGGKINQIPEGVTGTKQEPPTKPKQTKKRRKKDQCQECDKKEGCKIPPEYKPLCQKLEKYLEKEVDVKQKEKPLEITDRHCPNQWPVPPSTTELIIKLFFTDHKRVTQIADILGITHGHVSRTIKKYKQILQENLKK